MKLSEAKVVFEKLRKEGRIEPSRHVLYDHKNRGFTKDEIIYLIQETKGKLSDNKKFPTSTEGSFFYECKDILGRSVQFGLIFENNIIVIHAFRRV